MSIAGTCLGWSIDSDLPFQFLRPGHGEGTLEVKEWDPGEDPSGGGQLLVRWQPREEGAFHGSVHRMSDGQLTIETSDAGWLRLSPHAMRLDVPRDIDPITREVRLLTTPMLLLAAINGKASLHASCVEIGGRAVAIAAPGGSGKTTLAGALLRRGHGLLAEDVTIVDESGRVLPGPDLLRLRPDVAPKILRGSNLEVVHESDERIMVRSGTHRSEPVPLSAIIFLKNGDQRTLEKRFDPTRIADLWKVGFHFPNVSDRERAFNGLANLADTIAIYDLERPLGWESLEWSMDIVESLAE